MKALATFSLLFSLVSHSATQIIRIDEHTLTDFSVLGSVCCAEDDGYYPSVITAYYYKKEPKAYIHIDSARIEDKVIDSIFEAQEIADAAVEEGRFDDLLKKLNAIKAGQKYQKNGACKKKVLNLYLQKNTRFVRKVEELEVDC